MIWGLPFGTFFFVFLVPVIAVVMSIVYAVTFKDDDTWYTFDGKKSKSAEKNVIEK